MSDLEKISLSGNSAENCIEIHVSCDALELEVEQLSRLACFVLGKEHRVGVTLSLAFIGDEAMAELNMSYLEHEGPTDVIAFPLHEEGDEDALLGEVVVSLETAIRQAPEHGRDAHSEALLYVVHGILHLLGYDDHEEAARKLMHARQDELLEEFLGLE